MKLQYLMFCIAICLIGCVTGGDILPTPSIRHEGRWYGADTNGNTVIISLKSNGKASLVINKQNFAKKLNAKDVFYAINYEETPVRLDIIFTSTDNPSSMIKFNIDFLAEKMIRVWSNFDDKDPDIATPGFLMKKR